MNIGDFFPDYQIFYDYLLANDALIPLLKNCYIGDREASNAIDHYLSWVATPQGHDYWNYLSQSRPTVNISSHQFTQYYNLQQQPQAQQPYEFW